MSIFSFFTTLSLWALGLPTAVLNTLKVIEWFKKHSCKTGKNEDVDKLK